MIFLALMVGTALTVWAGLQNFPDTERDHRPDDSRNQSHPRRALLHARSLQFATCLGSFRVRAVLVGNSLRVDVQRLLDQRLAPANSQLDTTSSPAPQPNHRMPDIPIESWHRKF